ncbi:germination protein M [Natronincola peptidivorans]|uniref:Germination protein M n=1 Tax=Natronincola peptidivorans TaxID=426128 RepID=A0A1I0E3R5_9FIRM|nr:GerMN domain-containing protein [Natronincola peptidivorans]SET38976.1 germination protein M [Natronincola peptidivorans]
MKGYRLLAIVMILCLILVLSGCQNPLTRLIGEKDTSDTSYVSYLIDNEGFIDAEDPDLRKTVLYYRDEKGFVIPVMRRIPWEEGIAKSAVKQLIDRPIVREDLSMIGLEPVLPVGTEIIGMSIRDGVCRIDFNRSFLNYDTKEDEKAIVQSILYTLTEFDTIDSVQIMVGGEILKKLTYGTNVGEPLKREHINLTHEISQESMPVVVYYKGTVNGEETFFVPVTKAVNAIKVDIKTALTALLEGAPEDSGLYSEIPSGTTVNDVYVKDGVAYIDFSEEIKRMPESVIHQQSMVYELGLTLREIEPTIGQVRILSNGTEIQLSSNVSLNLPTFSNEF